MWRITQIVHAKFHKTRSLCYSTMIINHDNRSRRVCNIISLSTSTFFTSDNIHSLALRCVEFWKSCPFGFFVWNQVNGRLPGASALHYEQQVTEGLLTFSSSQLCTWEFTQVHRVHSGYNVLLFANRIIQGLIYGICTALEISAAAFWGFFSATDFNENVTIWLF